MDAGAGDEGGARMQRTEGRVYGGVDPTSDERRRRGVRGSNEAHAACEGQRESRKERGHEEGEEEGEDCRHGYGKDGDDSMQRMWADGARGICVQGAEFTEQDTREEMEGCGKEGVEDEESAADKVTGFSPNTKLPPHLCRDGCLRARPRECGPREPSFNCTDETFYLENSWISQAPRLLDSGTDSGYRRGWVDLAGYSTADQYYYWSFDSSGEDRLGGDLATQVSLPEVIFEVYAYADFWRMVQYDLLRKFHEIKGVD
ncbi:hypothetical protein B0H17DRAFT_1139413 [Mycena rosella]|uniref:Uncharacterized protein n=1 Tax=Mycena rosella TaxID=1033263 RepID=A0AAD7D4N7_MYCRO|nr:hypothetical protein B0H17DRAFT_1139413 [Mycena rosella]